MRKDIDELEILFNDRARETFYIWYDKFAKVSAKLDREGDENVFQQSLAQHLYMLKGELEVIAVELIQKNRAIPDINLLKRNLTNRINDLLQEFRLKSQAY